MAGSFAIFGGVVRLLTGIIVQKRRRLFLAQLESEKRRTALETIRRLMVTISRER